MGYQTIVRSVLTAVVVSLTTPVIAADANKSATADNKPAGLLSVMILGSGGPIAPPGRASSSYLIFTDGKPRILMEAGGGSYGNLTASAANIRDLDMVLLSHLHIDHTADLSAFIKGVYFQSRGAGTPREKPIVIYGPGANSAMFPGTSITQYPSTKQYVDGHYHPQTGVQRYLNIFAKAISGGKFAYTATDINPSPAAGITTVYKDSSGLVIKAVGVKHGPVPALAYRIEYKGKSIVFSGDTNSQTDNMINLAMGANLLLYDTAIMDNIPDAKKNPKDKVFYALHTTPSRMGQVAAKTRVGKLVLTHITPITAPRLKDVIKTVRDRGYKGPIEVATDLKVFNIN